MSLFILSVIICRQYIYNEKERKFVTLSTIKFHNKCVLKVIHHLLTCPAEHQQENVASVNRPLHCTAVLCSSATDGTVSLWDLQSSLSSWVHNESNIEPSALEGGILRDHPQISSEDPMILIQPHQSGVNDIAVCCNGTISACIHTHVMYIIVMLFCSTS